MLAEPNIDRYDQEAAILSSAPSSASFVRSEGASSLIPTSLAGLACRALASMPAAGKPPFRGGGMLAAASTDRSDAEADESRSAPSSAKLVRSEGVTSLTPVPAKIQCCHPVGL